VRILCTLATFLYICNYVENLKDAEVWCLMPIIPDRLSFAFPSFTLPILFTIESTAIKERKADVPAPHSSGGIMHWAVLLQT
jgi:hypothetical protein